MVQQTGHSGNKALTTLAADSHAAEVPCDCLHSGETVPKIRERVIIRNPTGKRGIPYRGGSGYPGVGAWGVRVGESPRKNIIKNEVGV